MVTAKKSGLGRGLSSLIGESYNYGDMHTDSKYESVTLLNLEQVIANDGQPRKNFDQKSLQELANSIKEKGVIMPILVKKTDKNQYIIVAGERRYRACKLAGVAKIPAIIKDINEAVVREFAIIENVQREDLSPLEEALAYKSLLVDYNYTQNDLAKIIGKSRSYVANLLRLLSLPLKVQEMIATNQLSKGHARALVTARDPIKAAKDIVAKGLNVRQAENFAVGKGRSIKIKGLFADLQEKKMLENAMSDQLGVKVSIDFKSHDHGIIMIYYNSLEELDKIFRLLPEKEKKMNK